MIDKKLEERLVVTLYDVISKGNSIEHDSPTIGCWQEYGHWSKEHGLYSSKEAAENGQKLLVNEYLEKGYSLNTKIPGFLGTSCEDVHIDVNPLEVDKLEIASDGNGNMFYKGRKILNN